MRLKPYTGSTDWRTAPRLYRGIHAFARDWHPAVTRIRHKGRDNVPEEGGLILVSNHFSWWDPIFISNVVPRFIGWLAKSELWAGPLSAKFFDAGGCIPVDRHAGSNEQVMRAALDALRNGRIVGIFPEATRSTPEERRPPKSGAARLALLSGNPVLPVAITSERFWGKGVPVPRLREPVYVNIGKPVVYNQDASAAEDRTVTGKITADIMAHVDALLDEAFEARDADATWD